MNNVMALPVPVGSLESYIQAINRFPFLSAEEEQRLARKFRSEDDVDAARQLVLSHLRLVVAVARGYMGYGLPQGDLIQEGNVGLMKAVRRFADSAANVKRFLEPSHTSLLRSAGRSARFSAAG